MKKYTITIMMLVLLIVISSGCTKNNTDNDSNETKSITETTTSVTTKKPTDVTISTQTVVTENITEAYTQTPTDEITENKEEISTDSISEPKKEDSTQASTSTPINITTYTSSVSQGGDAFIEIKGKPDTEYSIKVYYNNKSSKINGLENKITDADGYIRWEWTVGAKTASGKYKIIIGGDGQKKEIQFTVME